MDKSKKDKRDAPPAVFSDDPEAALEEELREHPNSPDAKVDVGSDESMDASDPISIVRPDDEEPVPSSGYPQDDQEEGAQERKKSS